MGMTIDKCIEKITHEKQCFIDECWHNNGELEAYDMAIEIMRKYQKIEQIVMKSPDEFKQCGLKELKEILEVLR